MLFHSLDLFQDFNSIRGDFIQADIFLQRIEAFDQVARHQFGNGLRHCGAVRIEPFGQIGWVIGLNEVFQDLRPKASPAHERYLIPHGERGLLHG